MSRRPRLTPRGQCFLGLGVATAAVGMLLGFPDITRIGVLLTCLPFLALLSGARPQPPLDVHRGVAPALAAPGTTVRVRLVLRNSGRRRSAPWLAHEELPDERRRSPRFLVPVMDPGEHHAVDYEVPAETRGSHPLGPLVLEHRDPFGLTGSRRALPDEHEYIVLPRIEPLDQAGHHGAGLGRDGQVPHMVALHGEDDMSIREYRDGDDLRRVHWPTTAHRGELMVRQEERPARRRAVLVLDTREAAFAGCPEAFEWAVSAVASAAVHLTGRGYAVHVVGIDPVPAAAGLPGLLRALALVEPHATSVAAALRQAQSLTGEGAVVVAAVADHDPTDTLRLAAVRTPGSPALALVLDTASFATRSGRPAPARERTDGLTDALVDAGWRCRTVTEGDTVQETWVSDRAGAATSWSPR
ncbi:DUF58 domain-containing protein [Georgenia sunbinii]|uniref:DUF58 domain-containing protein n=1 Tax=Georgenia sunbinii TaxID=3117728 RepID=UPI002F260093